MEILHIFFCHLLIFVKIVFKKFFQENPSEFQTVWIQIRPDFLLGMIWFQIVCKLSAEDTSRQRDNPYPTTPTTGLDKQKNSA